MRPPPPSLPRCPQSGRRGLSPAQMRNGDTGVLGHLGQRPEADLFPAAQGAAPTPTRGQATHSPPRTHLPPSHMPGTPRARPVCLGPLTARTETPRSPHGAPRRGGKGGPAVWATWVSGHGPGRLPGRPRLCQAPARSGRSSLTCFSSCPCPRSAWPGAGHCPVTRRPVTRPTGGRERRSRPVSGCHLPLLSVSEAAALGEPWAKPS